MSMRTTVTCAHPVTTKASDGVGEKNGNGIGQGASSRRLAPMDLERYRARVLDSYALVSYLPEPLGSFFNQLSKQLVPECRPKSHITLLPPRHLNGSEEEAKATLASVTSSLQPFELEITTIEMFDATSVIYADIGEGRDQLLSIHVDLNVDALSYQEQFSFHPHVTLAIHANPENIQSLLEEARLEWAAYPGERRFKVEHLHFVHNVALECWEDVARYTLETPSAIRGR